MTLKLKSLEGPLFSAKPTINELFTEIRKNTKGFKYYISTRVSVKKWDSSSETTIYDVIYGCSTPIEVTNQRFYLNKSFERLKQVVGNFFIKGSGSTFDEVQNTWIRISRHDPLAASSSIPLPYALNNSMIGLINIKNQGEDDCFKCCHLRLINPLKTRPETVTSERDKEILDSLDFSDINYPLKAKDHELVEERFNINVNILGYDSDSKKAYPLYISKNSN